MIKRIPLLLISALLFYGSICFSCHVVNPCDPIEEFDPAVTTTPPDRLDTSFGDQGAVLSSLPELTNPSYINGITKQIINNTDRILVAGQVTLLFADQFVNQKFFSLARYNLNGELDQTFNTNELTGGPGAIYERRFFGKKAAANALVVYPSNNIVAVGFAGNDMAAVSYRENGDPILENIYREGIINKTIVYPNAVSAVATAIELAPPKVGTTGLNVVIGGYCTLSNNTKKSLLVRLSRAGVLEEPWTKNATQSLNRAFGFNDRIVSHQINGVEVYPAGTGNFGTVIAVGQCTLLNGLKKGFIAWFKNDSGTLDLRFGATTGRHRAGYRIFDWGGTDESANAVVISPFKPPLGNLRFYIKMVGTSTIGKRITVGIQQVINIDNGDPIGGPVRVELPSDSDIQSTGFSSMVVQDLGNVPNTGITYAAGTAIANDKKEKFLLTRFNPDGTLDRSFGILGSIITTLSEGNLIGNGLMQQTNGKLVIAGYNQNFSLPDDPISFAMARIK